MDISGPSTGYTNQAFTYTLTAANGGTAGATGDVTIQFTLPNANLAVSTFSAPGFSESQVGQVITFSGGTIAAGGMATLSVTVADPVAETVTAAAGAAVIDPNDTVAESNYNNNASTTTVSTVLTPALTTSTIDVAPIVNTSFTGAVASFTDALAFNLNTYSATINWGDGGSSAGTVTLSTSGSGLYVVTGTHTYTSTGTEPVSVSLNDGNGDTATITSMRVGRPGPAANHGRSGRR